MLAFVLILIGLAGLWQGTEMVIKGAVRIAKYYQLSQVFVGITILAIGTDLPEVVIAINASIQYLLNGTDASGLIIGNAIGSSFSQISLVLGIGGLFGYLTMKRRRIYEDGAMLLGSVALVFLLGFDGEISQVEGLVLILVYGIYYFILVQREYAKKRENGLEKEDIKKDIYRLLAGMLIVIVAAELVVDQAIHLAEILGVRQSFVGIILIGLGTSLPELALTINAIKNKAFGLSVGNIIGSNIFDLLIPVGIGASVSGLQFERSLLWFDLSFLFAVSFFVLLFFTRTKGLQRVESVMLIGMFVVYAALKVAGV